MKSNEVFDWTGSGGVAVFNNFGTVRKSAGTGASVFDVTFNNSDTVEAQTGTIIITRGGSSDGNFSISGNAVVQLSSDYSLNDGISISGDGLLRLAAGTTTVSGNVTAVHFEHNGGVLSGSGNFTVSDTYDWVSSNMGGSGTTSMPSAGILTISGSTSGRTLNDRTFNQAGTTIFDATNTISAGSGAVFNNEAGALFDMKSNALFDWTGSGGVAQLNNLGTLRKSAGMGTSTIDIAVNSSSPVEVQTGTLSLTRGGTSSGNFTVSSGAVLNFGGETHTITLGDGESISAAGTVRFSGGITSIGGNGDYNVTGTTEVTGGAVNFNGAATTVNALVSGGTLGGSGVVTVTGNLDWTGGNFGGSGNLEIANTATFDISGGTSGRTVNTRTLNNAGTAVFDATNTISAGQGAVFNRFGFNSPKLASFLIHKV